LKRKGASGRARVIWSVLASTTLMPETSVAEPAMYSSAPSIAAYLLCRGEATSGSRKPLMVKATSSAVRSVPSLNLAFGWILKT
jgi:hypothetical protein